MKKRKMKKENKKKKTKQIKETCFRMIKVLKKEFKTDLKTLKLNLRPPFVVFLSGEMYSERTAVVKCIPPSAVFFSETYSVSHGMQIYRAKQRSMFIIVVQGGNQ